MEKLFLYQTRLIYLVVTHTRTLPNSLRYESRYALHTRSFAQTNA